MRVYLAAGVAGVNALAEKGAVSAPAFAVSAAMRRAEPTVDEDDLEYEAALLAEEVQRAAGERVVVIAANVLDATEPAEDGAVEIASVPRSRVVSLHVAEDGADEDEELLWFDVTELDQVRAYLEG